MINPTPPRLRFAAGAVYVLAFLAFQPVSVTANTNSPAVQALQQIRTVFVIPLENHDWKQACPTCSPEQIFGNPAAPYVNSLTTPGSSNSVHVSYATAYYSVAQGEHPSEPNYVWSEAGTEFGVHTDNDPSTSSGNLFSTHNHLCQQLNGAGIPWKSYQEDLEYTTAASISKAGTRPTGTNSYNGSQQYDYAAKHNPVEFFTDTENSNVFNLAQFWIDLTNNAIGRYNWITPDEYNEMHSGLSSYTYHGVVYTGNQAAIAEGDNFLSIVIPKIMASAAYQNNGVIVIWTDETESTDDTNTTLPFIIISSLAKGNAYASNLALSHSSTLKTMDEIFGLAFQTNTIVTASLDAQGTGYNYVDGRSAVVNDLSDMFQPICTPVVSWSFTNLTLNAVSNCSAAMIDVTGTNFIIASDTCSNSALTITQTPTNSTPLAVGTTNQVIITIADGTGSIVYSTNSIVVADASVPVIFNQPTSVTNYAGTTASFNVGATACTPLNYQWYFGANVLSGETNNTLNIVSVGPTNEGDYYAVVTSAGGSTNSNPATLTVIYQTPTIVSGQTMLGTNGYQVTFSGPSGQTYEVLASDDMTVPQSEWTVIGTGTFGGTNVTFNDPDATNFPNRFYVIKSP